MGRDFDGRSGHYFSPAGLGIIIALTVTADVSTLTVNVSFTFMKVGSFASVLSPVIVVNFASFIVSALKDLVNMFYNGHFGLHVRL